MKKTLAICLLVLALLYLYTNDTMEWIAYLFIFIICSLVQFLLGLSALVFIIDLYESKIAKEDE